MDKKKLIALCVGLLMVFSLVMILDSVDNPEITGKAVITGMATYTEGSSCVSEEEDPVCNNRGHLMICAPKEGEEDALVWTSLGEDLEGTCGSVFIEGGIPQETIDSRGASGGIIILIVILVLIVLATIGFLVYYLVIKDNESRNPTKPAGKPGMGRPGMPPGKPGVGKPGVGKPGVGKPGVGKPTGGAVVRGGSPKKPGKS